MTIVKEIVPAGRLRVAGWLGKEQELSILEMLRKQFTTQSVQALLIVAVKW